MSRVSIIKGYYVRSLLFSVYLFIHSPWGWEVLVLLIFSTLKDSKLLDSVDGLFLSFSSFLLFFSPFLLIFSSNKPNKYS